MSLLDEIKKIGVVPVIALDDPTLASGLANALCDGGLPVAEITFRVDNAAEVMKVMKQTRPEILIGAGTVLTTKQVDDALSAGAEFMVSPGFNKDVTKYCAKRNVMHLPGVATPSEVEGAIELGLKTLKFFPAELNGGLAYIKALCAPYMNVSFMPTGGLNPSNLRQYLEFEKIVAVGGTWIAKTNMIKEKKFDEIKALAAQAASIVKEVR